MATAYIIHSRTEDKFYVGSCLDFEMQLEQHQKGHFPKGYTSNAGDWTAFFLIDDVPIDTARRITKHFKKVKSQEYFDSLVANPQLAEDLKEEFQTRSRG